MKPLIWSRAICAGLAVRSGLELLFPAPDADVHLHTALAWAAFIGFWLFDLAMSLELEKQKNEEKE